MISASVSGWVIEIRLLSKLIELTVMVTSLLTDSWQAVSKLISFIIYLLKRRTIPKAKFQGSKLGVKNN